MEEKRKGYKTKEGQKKANERYLEKNPEAKERKKRYRYMVIYLWDFLW